MSDYNVKINVDTDEVIEKLEKVKALVTEINELTSSKSVVRIEMDTNLESVRKYVNEKNIEENKSYTF
ncbi:hypothetical protein QI340_00305 [Staphylococcus saprophyticus]|uniref:hypothetical protein n=1 Tax=Staphylococcus TaxID=1279 RepID=UPI001012639A|nr:hypothetical protein [Staphylococcus saprophyticus]MDW3925711.1 hypothetical protein [Staphylococcus saprophyticus]MDW3933603.1 hypothetical protein [Staphylococcus saprophyticus]MDW3954949.1 hypothetical protein [Staphylococcus saprophyticus]MDW4148541.1 hypothetical protein [Staphylococcus saprophyticus]RXS23223.1 hypothetical protein EUA47_03055 [Staphylococcus saprophyticus]